MPHARHVIDHGWITSIHHVISAKVSPVTLYTNHIYHQIAQFQGTGESIIIACYLADVVQNGVSDQDERLARSTLLAHEWGLRVRSVPPRHCHRRRHGRVISRMGSCRPECLISSKVLRAAADLPPRLFPCAYQYQGESRLSESVAIVSRRPDRLSTLTTQLYLALPGKIALMMRICTDQ